MEIESAVEELAYQAAFWMEGLENPSLPIDQMGETTLEVCETLRALGIAILLTRGDCDAFFHNLIRSGRTRLAFLERAAREGRLDNHDAGVGRISPLLDAVAAGEFDIARRVSAASRSTFQSDAEYADDHHFGRIIAALASDVSDHDITAESLSGLLGYLDGRPDGRWKACDALVRRDSPKFAEGLEERLQEREHEIDDDRERGQIENAIVMTQRYVFVEGLALLRLAERRGIATEADYRMCPGLARVAMTKPFPGF